MSETEKTQSNSSNSSLLLYTKRWKEKLEKVTTMCWKYQISQVDIWSMNIYSIPMEGCLLKY